MFLKRLSTALCIYLCFVGFVLGTNSAIANDAKPKNETLAVMAPLDNWTIPPVTVCEGVDGFFQFTVDQPGKNAASYNIDDQSGASVTDGYVNVSSNNINTSDFPLPANKYSVIVQYDDGTFSEPTPAIINEVIINIENSDNIVPACSNELGSLSFIVTGGTEPKDVYLEKNGSERIDYSNVDGTEYIFDNLDDGNYVANVNDGLGCTDSYGPIPVNIPNTISASIINKQDPSCEGSNGRFKVAGIDRSDVSVYAVLQATLDTITEHTLDYVFRVPPGTYDVTIEPNDCAADLVTINDITINEFNPVSLNMTPASGIVLDCANDNVTVDIEVTGGAVGKQVKVFLRDNADPNPNNEIQLGQVTYGSTITTNNPIGQGTYTIRWEDVNNPACTGEEAYIISGPPSPLEIIGTLDEIETSCYGSTDGGVQVNVSGGKTPYRYFVEATEYSDPADIQLAAGNYSFFVIDNNDCATNPRPITIEQPTKMAAALVPDSKENVACPGASTGIFSVQVSGGDGNYTYDLSGPVTATSISASAIFEVGNLLAGVYSIEVNDGNNCAAPAINSLEIEEPNPIVLNLFEYSKNLVCYGETTDLSVNATGGGVSSMTYRLIRNEVPTEKTGTGVVTFSNLVPSTYKLEIYASLDCNPYDTTFTIDAPTQLSIQDFSDSLMVDCNGLSAEFVLNVTGKSPFEYQIGTGALQAFTGGQSTTITGLSAAVGGQAHVITVYDDNGCQKEVNVTVYEPDVLTSTKPEITRVACKGEETGVVVLNVSGGTPGYEAIMGTYTQTSSDGTITFNNVAAGDYTIEISDDKGCVLGTVVEAKVEEPSSEFVIDNPIEEKAVLCSGGKANYIISASGGWAVSKEITVTGMGQEITKASGSRFELSAGNYTLTAVNTDGCTSTRDLPVSGPTPLKVTATKTNVTCADADDASITITVSGGVPPYRYGLGGLGTASNPITGNNITINGGLDSGNYDVIVRDDNDCQSNIVPLVISEPNPITFDVAIDTFVSCYGANDGTITILNASGGGVSNYKAWLTDDQGESSVTYPVINDLTAGNYQLRLSNLAETCYSELVDITIQEPTNINFLKNDIVNSVEHLKCFGENIGRIVVAAEGGSPFHLEYKITSGNGFDSGYTDDNDFTDLAPGFYDIWVRIKEKTSCVLQYSTEYPGELIEIEGVDPLLVNSVEVSDFNCFDDAQRGSVSIQASGGTGTLRYYIVNAPTWVDGDNTTGTFNQLGEFTKRSTTYRYYVEDQNLCRTAVDSFTIKNPPKLVLAIDDTMHASCHNMTDGELIVSVSGGTVNNAYNFDDFYDGNIVYQVVRNTKNNYKIEGLGSADPNGTLYQPRVTDDNACVAVWANPIRINNPKEVNFTVSIDSAKCFGDPNDKIILHASGGSYNYYYSLDGGVTMSDLNDSIFQDEPNGVKEPYVVDENGCEDPEPLAEFLYEEPELLVANVEELNGFRCWNDEERGNLKLSASGGTQPYNFYLINAPDRIDATNSTGDFDDLGEFDQSITRYDYIVTDRNGCQTDKANVTINNPPKLEMEAISTDASCHNLKDGFIEVTVVGGTVEDQYFFTDNLGRFNESQVEQEDINHYTIKGLGSTNPNGTLYFPLITDLNNCEIESESELLIGNPEEVNFTLEIDSADCYGDTDDRILLHAIGGTESFYYSLDNGATLSGLNDSVFVNEAEGLKTPYVVDENGCEDPTPLPEFLYEEPEPLIANFDVKGIPCFEDEYGNVILKLAGGTGNYQLSVNDPNFEATPNFSNPYTIVKANTDTTTYNMLNNSVYLPENETFRLYLKDSKGCHIYSDEINSTKQAVLTTIFDRPEKLVLEEMTQVPVKCGNDRTGRIKFKASGGNPPNYILSATKTSDPHKNSGGVNDFGVYEVNKLFAGTYRLTLTDENNCEAQYKNTAGFAFDTITIMHTFDSIQVLIYDTIQPVCDNKHNGILQIDINQYMEDGAFTKLSRLNKEIGLYQLFDTLSVSAAHGFVRNSDIPTYDTRQDTLSERMSIGTYQLVVVDNYSFCTDTVTFDLHSIDGPDCPPVNYYNVFTPHNGQSDNDEWLLYNSDYERYLLQIYTSYGELVYSYEGTSDEEGIKWNGLDNKQRPVPVGTYIYILEKHNGVELERINGNVSVLRNDGW